MTTRDPIKGDKCFFACVWAKFKFFYTYIILNRAFDFFKLSFRYLTWEQYLFAFLEKWSPTSGYILEVVMLLAV